MYQIEVTHDGLNKYRLIKGASAYEVNMKAQMQLKLWDQMWQRKVEAEQRKSRREREAASKEQQLQLALDATKEAEDAVAEAQAILTSGLGDRGPFDWDQLKDRTPFPKPMPVAPVPPLLPDKPDRSSIPAKPHPDDPEYRPELGLLDGLIPGRKQRAIKEARERYELAVGVWKSSVRGYNERVESHNRTVLELKDQYHRQKADYQKQIRSWERERSDFEAQRQQQYQRIENLKEAFKNREPDAVREFCERVLLNANLPAFCPRNSDLEYQPETGKLILEYQLPAIEDIPSIKAAKYDRASSGLVYAYFSQAMTSKLYEDINYQLVLRVLFEVFKFDDAGSVGSIVFNGFVETIDKATGQHIKPCIMSLQVSRSEFESIKLDQVDPKTCFKRLKGVSASKLQSLAAVAPVAQISREDKRFVESHDVTPGLDDSVNLASMDWEDFEHLIRELFAKEFETGGGEVRVTQASRDGGVDAVAFDPDPIRGGKIVIQAKRYTNVVGVSAVRDLYGTVMNEGAIKGILVTTSHYGSDAYEFAKGKPLALLDGGNLLHLLAKHGQKARINMREAKREMGLRGKKV